MPDIVIILVMCFPMFLFTVYPGIKLGEYLDNKYNLGETKKRYIVVSATIFVTFCISAILFYA